MKKIYLSGKIGEDPISEGTRMKFAKVAERLRGEGYKVFDPADGKLSRVINERESLYEMSDWPFDKYKETLFMCINELRWVDAIYMLPDWMDSPGAKAEHAFAVAIGLQVYYDDELFEDGTLKRAWNEEHVFPWKKRR